MLLARELRQQEAASLPGEEARIALPPLRAALLEAQELNATFESELASLRASLSASATAAQKADSIDKQLVSQLLVKYFERTRGAEPLTVLASMLDCTPDQRRALGVPDNGHCFPSTHQPINSSTLFPSAHHPSSLFIVL